MTHEELLEELSADIRAAIKWQNNAWLINAKALRAVVELHKPCEIEDWDNEVWAYCEGCSNSAFFPWKNCPTIQKIMDELK